MTYSWLDYYYDEQSSRFYIEFSEQYDELIRDALVELEEDLSLEFEEEEPIEGDSVLSVECTPYEGSYIEDAFRALLEKE